MSQVDLITSLKRAHSYDAWADRNAQNRALFVWRFVASDFQLPGWDCQKRRRFAADDGTATLRSIWQSTSTAATVLNVTVHECRSQRDSHEFLIHQLAEFQSPRFRALDAGSIGDIGFSNDDMTILAFTRGNVVVSMHNASTPRLSLGDAAQTLDTRLSERPERTTSLPFTKFFVLGLEEPVPIPVPVEDAADQPRWYKFIATGGDIRLNHNVPLFIPSSAGQQEILICPFRNEIAQNVNRLGIFVIRSEAAARISAAAAAQRPDNPTAERAFYAPILVALNALGGRGRVQDVLNLVEMIMKEKLTPMDYAPSANPLVLRWRQAAHHARFRMVTEGLLMRGSPWGTWEITPGGREWIL